MDEHLPPHEREVYRHLSEIQQGIDNGIHVKLESYHKAAMFTRTVLAATISFVIAISGATIYVKSIEWGVVDAKRLAAEAVLTAKTLADGNALEGRRLATDLASRVTWLETQNENRRNAIEDLRVKMSERKTP